MTLNRRVFLSMIASTAAMPLFAISTSGAERFVSSAIGELERLINSGQSGSALQSSLKSFLRKYADISAVSRAVIGAPWRGMSGAQKSAYVAAFENYIAKKYSTQLGIYKGGKAQITRTRDGGKSGVLVSAEFLRAGQAPIAMDMQVSDQSGSPKILDLKLEGVSMIGTERTQVRAMFAQSGNNVDALIAQLNS